jgi:hypothetical protein
VDFNRSTTRRSTKRANRPRGSGAAADVTIRGGAGIFSNEKAGTVIPSSLSRNTLGNFHPNFFGILALMPLRCQAPDCRFVKEREPTQLYASYCRLLLSFAAAMRET